MTDLPMESDATPTQSTPTAERFWRLGDIVIDRDKRCVFRDSEVTRLEPRIFALLLYFLQHPGRELTRQELAARVWNGTNVVDEAIQRGVSILRAALGDTPKQGLHIQTTATGGYRLVSEVVSLPSQLAQAQLQWRSVAIAAAAGLALGVLGMSWFGQSQSHYAPEAPPASASANASDAIAPLAP